MGTCIFLPLSSFKWLNNQFVHTPLLTRPVGVLYLSTTAVTWMVFGWTWKSWSEWVEKEHWRPEEDNPRTERRSSLWRTRKWSNISLGAEEEVRTSGREAAYRKANLPGCEWCSSRHRRPTCGILLCPLRSCCSSEATSPCPKRKRELQLMRKTVTIFERENTAMFFVLISFIMVSRK